MFLSTPVYTYVKFEELTSNVSTNWGVVTLFTVFNTTKLKYLKSVFRLVISNLNDL